MENLILIHRTTGPAFEGSDLALVWTTCLRQILLTTKEPTLLEGDERFEGAEAWAFLLEVVCGLRSPILGETEVQGQYRQFLQLHKQHPLFLFLIGDFQKVLTESKKLRSRYLCGTGSQSYGSLHRKMLPEGEATALVGAGLLAQEIHPWLSGVQVFTRTPEKSTLAARPLSEIPNSQIPVWIIAAPVADSFLRDLVQSQTGLKILIDLRGGNAGFQPSPDVRFYNLQGFMKLFEQQNDLRDQRKKKALAAVDEWKLMISSQIQIRPFGWEDLCR